MEAWLIWTVFGLTLMALEAILPGGIIVFVGMAALCVGAGFYMQWIDSWEVAALTWFVTSIGFMLILRSFFIRFFEGDSKIQNVDEDKDLIGSLVEVVEPIFDYKEGRVKFRDTTWSARSDDQLETGETAMIVGREGQRFIVKALLD